MGLLDMMDDPTTAMAMGLLSAGGFSRTPVSLGQAMGQGYGEYQQSRLMQDRRKQAEMQAQMQGMQMDAMREQMSSQRAIKAQLEAFKQANGLGGVPDEIAMEYFKQSMKPRENMLGKVDPKDFEPTSIAEFLKTGDPSALKHYTDPNKMSKVDELAQRHADRMAQIEAAARMRPPAQPAQPYYSPVVDATRGVGTFDHRTGQMKWGEGSPVIKPADSPSLQGQIAGAKESAKTMAEETTKAALDAPRIIDNATTALKYSDELLKHPGFKQAVGASSMLGIQKIHGTDAKDFMNRLDQLKGGAFLEAFNTLKGGGQITEVEGKKATDAIARMDNATSEGEFIAAVNDYKDVIKRGMNRAKMKAKPVAQPVVDTSVDALLKKYGG